MNVGEMLSRCTPGCHAGVGGGAIIQCRDLMAAMGQVKCPEWMVLLVRMKYMGEDSRHETVTMWVMAELSKISTSRSWPHADGKEQPLTKLARLAIAEYLLGECCAVCNGQKQIGPVICHGCEGTGLPISDDARRGTAAGFHPVRWLNIWSAKYPYAQAIVRNADELVINGIRRNLGSYAEVG